MTAWRVHSIKVDTVFETQLSLYWEIDGDPITDDYTPEEASAEELWDMWVGRYGKHIMPIIWTVHGDGTSEYVPPSLQPQLSEVFPDRDMDDHRKGFLAHYSWPVDAVTGERLRWSTLAVEDKLWRPDAASKGGFIQEATGWKPSPLQSYADIKILAAASGLKQP